MWTAAPTPLVFPKFSTGTVCGIDDALRLPRRLCPPSEGDVAQGMGGFYLKLGPNLSGVGRLTLKVAGSPLLAAIGGAAMVAQAEMETTTRPPASVPPHSLRRFLRAHRSLSTASRLVPRGPRRTGG